MRLPWIPRSVYEEYRNGAERLYFIAQKDIAFERERNAQLFAAYEKLRDRGLQPPPPPAPKTFADPAEEPIARMEDEMNSSLVQQFISEGHSQTEAEAGAAELFAAWHGGAL